MKTRNSSVAIEHPRRTTQRKASKIDVADSHNSEDSNDELDIKRSRRTRRSKYSDNESSTDSLPACKVRRTVRVDLLKKAPIKPLPPRTRQLDHAGLSNGQHVSSLRLRDRANRTAVVSTDDDMNEDDDSMVRRSTRCRKSIYNNLNQSWILTTSVPDFKAQVAPPTRSKKEPATFNHHLRSGVNHSSVPAGANGSLDGDNEDSLESKNDKGGNGELRRLGLADIPSSASFTEDMYSRVKRTRQHRPSEQRPFFKTRQSRRAAGERPQGEAGSDTEEGQASSDDTGAEDTEDEGALPVMNGYHLRPKKPVTERFQAPVVATKRSTRIASIFHTPKHDRCARSFKSPAHRDPMYSRKRHATHNSSSTSSSSDDECRFERRKARSMVRARNRCLPLNFQEKDLLKGVLRDRAKIGSSLADVDPMHLDKEVMFDKVGGLDGHIQQLKEMILFPLIYPEVFEKFKITPPRGVLFHGAPGTGKTLVARALANECGTEDRRVAFFMRKGADCLSKWVGESERQLRMLFDQAYSMRPSIIFFDEIDGLAPVRSTRQDQIHSSIVSTLLALMDGLDSRGEVVVIGATNRVDAIDPALRRPGRFDREFHFALPCHQARLSILEIHTQQWQPPPGREFLSELAARCVGYCGADLKSLCAEAALVALRRNFPQIYQSKEKLQLNMDAVQILPEDYERAMRKIVPAAQRCSASPARPLTTTVRPLLVAAVEKALAYLNASFAVGLRKSAIARPPDGHKTDSNSLTSEDEAIHDDCDDALVGSPYDVDKTSLIPSVRSRFTTSRSCSHRPRLLVCGRPGLGQTTHVAPAILHLLEHLPLHRLDLPALHSVTARAPEEACAQVLQECQRVVPGVVYLPHLCHWWETLADAVRATFLTLLSDLEPQTPVLCLATADVPFDCLPQQVKELFYPSEVLELGPPTLEERRRFFAPVFAKAASPPKAKRATQRQPLPTLPAALPPEPRKLTPSELERLRQQEEATFRELRLFLRDILTKLLRDRRYSMFAKPVDADEVPDYLEVIEKPMDLETMMVKIDLRQYHTVAQFLADVDLICSNALEYNPDRDPTDKNIRHRACALQDAAHALVDTELDWGFEKICQDIVQARKERGEAPVAYMPKNYNVVPRHPRAAAEPSSVSAGAEVTARSEQGSEDVGGKRFSRRLRGLDAPSDAEDGPEGGDAPARAAEDGGGRDVPSTPGNVPQRRPPSPKSATTRNYEVGRPAAKRRRLVSGSLLADGNGTNPASTTADLPGSNASPSSPAASTKTPPASSSPARSPSSQPQVLTTPRVRADCQDSSLNQSPEVPQELKLDRKKLGEVEERTLSLTGGCSVESLERLHCALLNAVHRHHQSWDRGPMITDLAQELEQFQSLLRRQSLA